MTEGKISDYVRSESKAKDNFSKDQERKKSASTPTTPNVERDQFDKWFIGFDAKEGIHVPRNAIPKPLLDVLSKPMSIQENSGRTDYDRSKFQLTGLHAGDESRVEIALLAKRGGGGFADVMPDRNSFVITVPALFEFESILFTADEFLQAVNAAKAHFQIRGNSNAIKGPDGGTEKP